MIRNPSIVKDFLRKQALIVCNRGKVVKEIEVHCAELLVDFMTNFATQTYSHLTNNNWMNITVALINHNPFKTYNSFLKSIEILILILS